MDKMLNKKINLLLHLAKVDGKFAQAEKKFLESILIERGLEASFLGEYKEKAVSLRDFKNISDKTELLFWVLKLIHADNRLHLSEIEYSRIIANELSFREEVVDYFILYGITSLEEFEKDIKNFRMPNVQQDIH